jgi:hypothetical protein
MDFFYFLDSYFRGSDTQGALWPGDAFGTAGLSHGGERQIASVG